MILVFLQLRLFSVLLYLYQASSLNIQKFLRRYFSVESSKLLRVSPVLLDITLHLNLSLSLFPELCWMHSLFLFEMMLWSLPYLFCKGVLIECSDGRRNVLFARLETNPTLFVNRLTPVISAVPVTSAVPPLRGCPRLVSASVTRPPDPGRLLVKKVRFAPVPASKLRWNPHRTVWASPPLSAILQPHLLEGETCGYFDDLP